MRRTAHLAARTIVVLLLLAAVADVPLPASSRPRLRVHLIDRSASVFVGPESSRRPKDADATASFDRGRLASGDEVLLASFAGDLRFESPLVDDPGRTDLRGALEGVLARDPTEIVLHSDGRADPGSALGMCRARGVPVHVMPLGAAAPQDIRFSRIRAPGDAAPGERFSIEATIESTWSVLARVRLGEEVREIDLAPGAPGTLAFPERTAGDHALSILTEDHCPQNNAVKITVLPRTSRRRVVAVPGEGLPDLKDVELLRGFAPLTGVHAVIVNGPVASKEQRDAIARYVREGGGGLFLGGRASFGRDWADTVLDEISPLRAKPDHRVAVALGVDVSGSMQDHLRTIVDAAREAAGSFGDGDILLPFALSEKVELLTRTDALLSKKAEGQTQVAHWLREIKKEIEQKDPDRKHVLLFTDGIVPENESPQARREAWEALRNADIGLTVVTIDRELDIAKPNVKLKEGDNLGLRLAELFAGIREVWREKPGRLDFHPHPFTSGLAAIEPAGMNLTSGRPATQVVASVGRAPAYRAIAFGQAGFGKTGAIAFAPDAALLARALSQVARLNNGAHRLTVEPPLVRARGPGTSPRLRARANGVEFDLLQVRSDLWEGLLPSTASGTIFVELADGSSAAAVVPCLPEFERVGVDLEALKRIAEETGGRLLQESADLASLPPPAAGGRRSGRSWFLVAALAFLFAELGIATFWKAR